MKRSTKTTIRTVVQTGAGFAVAAPALVAASGLDTAWPWVAGGLAVAAAVTRLMAVPYVQGLMGFLNTDDETVDYK